MPTAVAAGNKASARMPAAGHARRLDIEGLRAVAVVAVVLDHLFHWPRGGFVGVDIFFVISGYLISGILLREARETGRISFRQFYVRRLKRILPAAALVLSVTITAAYMIFYGGRATSIAGDAFWALLFSANWRFAVLGTDYMNSGASLSPIQHYWSLGVEEQFYIIWPWIILGALYVANRIGANRRGMATILGVAVLVPTAVSFAFAMWETQANHTVAYFSTFSRAWELGAGAFLAVTTASFAGFRGWVRSSVFWLGIVLLVGSAVIINPETPFPAPYAFIPVAGSCLVILAGAGKEPEEHNKRAWILTNPVSRYVGKISYSLYLWHFPVIVLLGAFIAPETKVFYLVAIVTMAGLSIASFKFVEDPIRRSSLGAPRRELSPGGKQRRRRAAIYVAAFAAVVIAFPLTAFATLGQNTSGTESAGPRPTGIAQVRSVGERQVLLRSALAANEWPALSPNPAEMGPDGALAKPTEWIKDGCLGGELSPLAHDKDVIANARRCVYGNATAPESMIIFGDSTTMSFVPGIRAAVAGEDWRIYIYTVAACSPTLAPDAEDGSAAECKRFKAWVQNEIQRLRPTQVVSSFLRNDGHLKSGATGQIADTEWRKNIAQMAKFVVENGSRFVLLEAPTPAKAEPSQCITRFSKPSDCITERPMEADRQSFVEAKAVQDAGAGAVFVPTADWFCVEGKCPAFAGGTALYADKNHISARASEELGPLLRQLVTVK